MPNCIQCHKLFIDPFNALTFYRRPAKLCEQCTNQWKEIALKLTLQQRCSKCLKLLEKTESVCLDCAFLSQQYPLMHQLYCDFKYDGIMKQLMHQYKFMKDVAISDVFATRLRLPRGPYDVIIPIPSPYERDLERTFNPVEVVLKKMKVNYEQLLVTRVRPKQSLLGKQLRARLDNPFEISKSADLENKYVLLVDDIYTTGITVHQAIAKLSVRKIRKFDVFTFAR
ncbi:ComF family protein [Staphylococcus caeli]|uniref:Competence protein ComF n=1 Tax=Staphylococcus caeli TaxID=2201815 RepID=A0A1D4GZV0_9STAP|nr:phosphoribosyltransferase family protein [Staphylococcus caeli]SCS30425.1 competence protein ComF [Staphylococcus caeli]SCS36792.1 competence protein ComF [Staphylococcus caeli]